MPDEPTDVEHLRFPDRVPMNLTLGIPMNLCFSTKHDKRNGIILLCTRPKDHSRRHSTGNGEIITRVWS